MKNTFLVMSILFCLLMSCVSFSLPTPKYLSVPQWKSCVKLTRKEAAEFICLPFKKPTACPKKSWRYLVKNQLINRCSMNN